jgi:hypothetical protein
MLHRQLSHSLGCAHDAARIHGLVSRDHQKAFGPKIDGCLGNRSRAQNVIQNRFAAVGFHHGNMLVSGGVKHDVGFARAEDGSHAIAVADIGDERDQPHSRIRAQLIPPTDS